MVEMVGQLKCIGGARDGHKVLADMVWRGNHWGHRVGDTVMVREKVTPLTDIDPNKPNLPDKATIKHYEYEIAVFCFINNEFYYFLRPKGWTDKQAILYQFSK